MICTAENERCISVKPILDEFELTPSDDPGGLVYDLIAIPDSEIPDESEMEICVKQKDGSGSERVSRLKHRRRKMHSKSVASSAGSQIDLSLPNLNLSLLEDRDLVHSGDELKLTKC